ncbi:MAG: hypothetical protein BRD50_05600, partial [Bacteroidetes bacterium SW_11_45_7]
SYRIRKANGQTEIAVTVPVKWLVHSDRQYPVVVDPSVAKSYPGSGKIQTDAVPASYTEDWNNITLDNDPVTVYRTDVEAEYGTSDELDFCLSCVESCFENYTSERSVCVQFSGPNSTTPCVSGGSWLADPNGEPVAFSNSSIANGNYPSGEVDLDVQGERRDLNVSLDFGIIDVTIKLIDRYSAADCCADDCACGWWGCYGSDDIEYNENIGTKQAWIEANSWEATFYYCELVEFSSNISGSKSICEGGSKTFNVNANVNSNDYQWYRNGNPISGATSSSYTASPSPGTYTYKVKAENSCDSEFSDTYTLTVDPEPSVGAGYPVSDCQPAGSTPKIDMSGASANNYDQGSVSWSKTSGSGSGTFGCSSGCGDPANWYFNPSSSSGDITAELLIKGKGACSGTTISDTRQISWNAEPGIFAGSKLTKCSKVANIQMTGASATNYSTATWTVSGSYGGFDPASNPDDWLFVPNADTIDATFTVTLEVTGKGVCSGKTLSDTRQIELDPVPSVVAGPDTTTCSSNGAIGMDGASASNYGNPTWAGGNSYGSWSQAASPANATFTPKSDTVDATFTATLTVDGLDECSSTTLTDTRQIELDPAPVARSGPDTSFCTHKDIKMAGSYANYEQSLKWTGGSGTWVDAGSNPDEWIYEPDPNKSGQRNFAATLTVYAKDACASDSVKVSRSITLNEAPEVDAGSGHNTCGTGSIDLDNASAQNHSSINWTLDSTSSSYYGYGTMNGTGKDPSTYSFDPNANADSGRILAVLTATSGTGACNGVSVSDSVIISWGGGPKAFAGSSIDGCRSEDIYMTGASVSGPVDNWKWEGADKGVFISSGAQNPDDKFYSPPNTPTSGSDTVELIAEPDQNCPSASRDTSTRVLSWTEEPSGAAGNDTSVCTNASILMTGSSARGTIDTVFWKVTNGSGGSFTFTGGNANDPTNYEFVPSINAGSVEATLTIQGKGGCDGVTATYTRDIKWSAPPNGSTDDSLVVCGSGNIDMAKANPTISGEVGSVIWDFKHGSGSFGLRPGGN